MKTTIDRFGRVVIPKDLREDLGLEAGTAVEVEAREGEVRLRPLVEEAAVVDKQGVLVFDGEAQGDLRRAIARQRKMRSDRVGGGRRSR